MLQGTESAFCCHIIPLYCLPIRSLTFSSSTAWGGTRWICLIDSRFCQKKTKPADGLQQYYMWVNVGCLLSRFLTLCKIHIRQQKLGCVNLNQNLWWVNLGDMFRGWENQVAYKFFPWQKKGVRHNMQKLLLLSEFPQESLAHKGKTFSRTDGARFSILLLKHAIAFGTAKIKDNFFC